jgi:signal transduction histidine kinase
VLEITDEAEAIGAGTLQRRIRASADLTEYDRLVAVLNTMLDRLETAFDVQRRFIGDASHELRSPLTALRGELELARMRERSPQTSVRIGRIFTRGPDRPARRDETAPPGSRSATSCRSPSRCSSSGVAIGATIAASDVDPIAALAGAATLSAGLLGAGLPAPCWELWRAGVGLGRPCALPG